MINNNHENILVLNNVKELDTQQKTIYTKKKYGNLVATVLERKI